MSVVDLTHPLTESTPCPDACEAPRFEMAQELGPKISQITAFSLNTHMGTHMDAPSHFVKGTRSITDFPIERFVLPAVVVRVTDAEVIDVVHLEPVADRVHPGCALLIGTGMDSHFGTPRYHDNPYLTEDAARWITAHGITLVGIDFMTPDMPISRRPAGYTCPVHLELLGNDVLIIENLTGVVDLDADEVELIAAPIPLNGLDGAPVRAVARLPEKENV